MGDNDVVRVSRMQSGVCPEYALCPTWNLTVVGKYVSVKHVSNDIMHNNAAPTNIRMI